MSAAHDGGPAFPVADRDHQTFAPRTVEEVVRLLSGMSLRDYFAAQALPVAMQCVGHNYAHDIGAFTWDSGDVEAIALRAYELADAMLEARK